MQKPNGYDETQEMRSFTPAELGGHHIVIKAVKEQKSKNGNPMIVVAFDFARNDKQPGYFSDLFEKDIRPDKKWPNAGTSYIMTQDYNDPAKTNRSFKSFIRSVERSNNMEVTWGDKFEAQFKGKKIGGVFGVVEEEYNGKVSKRHKLRWFCDDDQADSANIPDEKLLNDSVPSSRHVDANGFMDVDPSVGDEIPF